MRRVMKIALAGLGVAGTLLITGCQSTGAQKPQASHEMAADAVQCDKCQYTWVKTPIQGGKGRVTGYTTQKRMECPDCRDAVSNFFATGKFRHECTACGGNLAICDAH